MTIRAAVVVFFFAFLLSCAIAYRRRNRARHKMTQIKSKLRTVEHKLRQLNFTKEELNETILYQRQKLTAEKKYLLHRLQTPSSNEPVEIVRRGGSRICFVMIGNLKIYPYFSVSIDLNYEYAKSHGYDFHAVVGRVLGRQYSPHFDRYRLFATIFQCLKPKYAYILYLDADAFVSARNQSIERFISLLKPNTVVLASTGCRRLDKTERSLPINTGVLLLKNSKKTIELCEAILTDEPDCYLSGCRCKGTGRSCIFFDQCVIDRLQQYHSLITLLPYGVLQTFMPPSNCEGNADLSKPSFVKHISGQSEEVRVSHMANARKDFSLENVGCSVFILNYRRPHNIERLLVGLCESKYVDEIVVSNGHRDFVFPGPLKAETTHHPKIVFLNDFSNELGAAKRFPAALSVCSSQHILFVDDDVIPSAQLISDLLYKVQQDPLNIYGPFNRSCTRNGYFSPTVLGKWRKAGSILPTNVGVSSNTVLTPILMTSRSLLQKYMRDAFPKFMPWFRKYKGNCEDLSLNVYLHSLGLLPQKVEGTYKKLDGTGGYSSKSSHMKVRNSFCQKFGLIG